MSEDRHTNPIEEILASIRNVLPEAHSALERGEDTAWRIEEAFVTMRVLLETARLPEALRAVQEMEATARVKWDATETDEFGEPFFVGQESSTAMLGQWRQRLASRKRPQ